MSTLARRLIALICEPVGSGSPGIRSTAPVFRSSRIRSGKPAIVTYPAALSFFSLSFRKPTMIAPNRIPVQPMMNIGQKYDGLNATTPKRIKIDSNPIPRPTRIGGIAISFISYADSPGSGCGTGRFPFCSSAITQPPKILLERLTDSHDVQRSPDRPRSVLYDLSNFRRENQLSQATCCRHHQP